MAKKQYGQLGLQKAIGRVLDGPLVTRTRTMRDHHAKNLSHFHKWALDRFGPKVSITDIGQGECHDYLAYLESTKATPNTIHNYFHSFKRFMALAHSMGICADINSTLSVLTAQVDDRELPKKAYTPEQCAEFFRMVDGDRSGKIPVLTRLQLATATRPSETIRLANDEGEWREPDLFIPTLSKTKGSGIRRHIYLTPLALELLERAKFIAANDPTWFTSNRADDYGEAAVYHADPTLYDPIDPDYPLRRKHFWTAHKLRHTAATLIGLEPNLDPVLPMRCIWHKSALPDRDDAIYAQPFYRSMLQGLQSLSKYIPPLPSMPRMYSQLPEVVVPQGDNNANNHNNNNNGLATPV